jgi:hypothetical protein
MQSNKVNMSKHKDKEEILNILDDKLQCSQCESWFGPDDILKGNFITDIQRGDKSAVHVETKDLHVCIDCFANMQQKAMRIDHKGKNFTYDPK